MADPNDPRFFSLAGQTEPGQMPEYDPQMSSWIPEGQQVAEPPSPTYLEGVENRARRMFGGLYNLAQGAKSSVEESEWMRAIAQAADEYVTPEKRQPGYGPTYQTPIEMVDDPGALEQATSGAPVQQADEPNGVAQAPAPAGAPIGGRFGAAASALLQASAGAPKPEEEPEEKKERRGPVAKAIGETLGIEEAPPVKSSLEEAKAEVAAATTGTPPEGAVPVAVKTPAGQTLPTPEGQAIGKAIASQAGVITAPSRHPLQEPLEKVAYEAISGARPIEDLRDAGEKQKEAVRVIGDVQAEKHRALADVHAKKQETEARIMERERRLNVVRQASLKDMNAQLAKQEEYIMYPGATPERVDQLKAALQGDFGDLPPKAAEAVKAELIRAREPPKEIGQIIARTIGAALVTLGTGLAGRLDPSAAERIINASHARIKAKRADLMRRRGRGAAQVAAQIGRNRQLWKDEDLANMADDLMTFQQMKTEVARLAAQSQSKESVARAQIMMAQIDGKIAQTCSSAKSAWACRWSIPCQRRGSASRLLLRASSVWVWRHRRMTPECASSATPGPGRLGAVDRQSIRWMFQG
jgi:hypothetical protein